MKKITCLLFVIMYVFSFSGCNVVQKVFDFAEEREVDIDTAKAKGKMVFECFENRDEETLKSLLSQSVISNGDIEEEIKEAFELYHGNAVEYNVSSFGFIDSTYDDGVITKKDTRVKIEITTDTGEQYRISVDMYLLYDSQPTNIGIYSIVMSLLYYEDSVYKYEGNIYRHIGGDKFLD